MIQIKVGKIIMYIMLNPSLGRALSLPFQTRTRRSCWQTNSQRLRLLLLLLLMMLAHMRRSSFKLAEILGKAQMLIYSVRPNEGF